MINTGLHVLITNNALAHRAGSELYVRDLALALLRRGYNPITYSTELGEVAEELRLATVPVIDDLNALNITPDLIHGQHHLDAMTAMLHFPKVPALVFCHGWLPWEEMPPVCPSIVRYLAVDDLCKERLLTTPGIVPEKIRTLYNFVDLAKFKPRPQLPEKPHSALIFSNYASENSLLNCIRAACQRYGIEHIEVAGQGSGNPITHPEKILSGYDVVFAKGRCALEALAVGCAVIVADFPGLGGMVNTKNMVSLRHLNFGVRTMQASILTEDSIFNALSGYDAIDVQHVCTWIRSDACLERTVDQLEKYYAEVIAETENIAHIPLATWTSAASTYLRTITPTVKTRNSKNNKVDELIRHIGFMTELLPDFTSAVINKDLSLTMQPIPQRQAENLRYIDQMELINGKLQIKGWACDGRDGQGCSMVLVIANNKVIASAPITVCRPDVQQYNQLITERAGFELIIDAAGFQLQELQVIAITRDGKLIPYSTPQKITANSSQQLAHNTN